MAEIKSDLKMSDLMVPLHCSRREVRCREKACDVLSIFFIFRSKRLKYWI